MNGKAVGTYILTFYLFISYFRGTPLLPEVRNCNQRLCAFVPHCPAAFWTELTRNLPNVHHRIVDTCTRPASGPADPAGFYSALQVYSGTGTLWGLSCKRACTLHNPCKAMWWIRSKFDPHSATLVVDADTYRYSKYRSGSTQVKIR